MEQKTISGLGKPAGRVHFHLLVGCSMRLTKATFTDLWERVCYGGSWTTGEAADVQEYRPEGNAAIYLLKCLDDPGWDWEERNLELVSPVPPASAAHHSRLRWKLRRSAERRAIADASPRVDALQLVGA